MVSSGSELTPVNLRIYAVTLGNTPITVTLVVISTSQFLLGMYVTIVAATRGGKGSCRYLRRSTPTFPHSPAISTGSTRCIPHLYFRSRPNPGDLHCWNLPHLWCVRVASIIGLTLLNPRRHMLHRLSRLLRNSFLGNKTKITWTGCSTKAGNNCGGCNVVFSGDFRLSFCPGDDSGAWTGEHDHSSPLFKAKSRLCRKQYSFSRPRKPSLAYSQPNNLNRTFITTTTTTSGNVV